MKKFKSVVAVGLSAAMIAGVLAGCTSTKAPDATKAPADDKQTEAPKDDATKADGETEAQAPAGEDEGKVLNIYTWNTEFIERLEAYYPGYEVTEQNVSGKIGDVTVKFTTVPSDNNAYQDNLDEALLAQADAAADDKVDMFLLEADYALKYVDTDYTMDLAELGLSADVFAGQYQYTKDVVTDSNGALKGSSWQGCPGALIYNRNIAKEVFGTDEPSAVQAFVKDWDTFLESAAKLKEAGYMITATVNDTFRVFSNNVTSKWAEDGKVNIDANIAKWVEMSKAMVDAGYTDTQDLWSAEWNNGMKSDSKVFCYFGPAWMIDFSMHDEEEGYAAHDGIYGLTEGPQGFFWGGTWVAGATGTDNPTLVADIIKTMTTDEEVLSKILTEKGDFVNSSAVNNKYAEDETYGMYQLGGQNPYGIFSAGVSTVDLSNLSAYDQGCNETFQKTMKGYFDGTYATYEDAVAKFNEQIVVKYPDLTF